MKYNTEKLKIFTANVIAKAGLSREDSLIFAESIVNADMRGISSHGLTRLSAYVRRVQDGLIATNVEPVILEEQESLLLVDAQNGMGAVSAYKIMQMCMKKASDHGCCFATVRNGNHFGYGGFFPNWLRHRG